MPGVHPPSHHSSSTVRPVTSLPACASTSLRPPLSSAPAFGTLSTYPGCPRGANAKCPIAKGRFPLHCRHRAQDTLLPGCLRVARGGGRVRGGALATGRGQAGRLPVPLRVFSPAATLNDLFASHGPQWQRSPFGPCQPTTRVRGGGCSAVPSLSCKVDSHKVTVRMRSMFFSCCALGPMYRVCCPLRTTT